VLAMMAGLGLAAPLVLGKVGMTQTGLCYILLGGALGFYLPGVVVDKMKKKRAESIFLGLPDALDLMVVCVEAGLGLDLAMRRVTTELATSCPVLCEEFAIANFQAQMGRARKDVLRDLGVRTGVDDVRSVAAVVIQAEKFGSSIGSALRVLSDSMRLKRRQLAEERAAKTAVKIMIPLVLFIFPGVFVVLVGPAGIQIAKTLMGTGSH
jgi:tight adherence protein C